MAAAAALVLVFTPACDQKPGADATPPTEQAGAEAEPSPVGGERPEVAERPQDRQAQERPGQRAQPDPKPGAQQDPRPGAQQAPPTKPSGEVSEAQIKSFATAVKGVSEVQQGMTAEIQKAESPEEAKKIQDDMREKINEVLADADIEPDAFREMAQRMQADQEFRQRVQPHLAGGG